MRSDPAIWLLAGILLCMVAVVVKLY